VVPGFRFKPADPESSNDVDVAASATKQQRRAVGMGPRWALEFTLFRIRRLQSPLARRTYARHSPQEPRGGAAGRPSRPPGGGPATLSQRRELSGVALHLLTVARRTAAVGLPRVLPQDDGVDARV
jgi:hypothetical protein